MAIQKVYVDPAALENIKGEAGELIELPLLYTTSDEGTTPGITIAVHYDSTALELVGVDEDIKALQATYDSPTADSGNDDNDATTNTKFDLVYFFL